MTYRRTRSTSGFKPRTEFRGLATWTRLLRYVALPLGEGFKGIMQIVSM